ncbi:MAG: transposase [Lachnospiraceae bacterium]|nr:transposase [Lachnospiraceae bacterium]
MKTCHVCGTQVDDRELICPECGATVVASTGGLSLKPQEPQKKKKGGSPIGTTVSTGSGLTDLLRAEDDDVEVEDDLSGGSIPLSFSKTVIDDDYDYKARQERKRIKKNLIKFIVVLVIAIGAYFAVTKVLSMEKRAQTPEQVLDFYMEAINNSNVEKLELIMPVYISDTNARAQSILDDMKGAHIDSYNISKKEEYGQEELIELQDSIKYQTARTANLKGAVKLTLVMNGTANRMGENIPVRSETEMTIVKLKKGMGEYYFIHIDAYDNTDFNYK